MEQEQMKLNQGQQKAFEKILHFFSDENTDTPVFILKGYAGTGKTTLLKEVVRALQKHPLHLMAPTGRATRVLEQISGCRATTIHKGIYTMKDPVIMKTKDIADTSYKYIFRINRSNTDRVLAIVDEASMVSSKKSDPELFQFGSGYLLKDLLDFARASVNGRILFVGDPAQLPPVGDNRSCALDEQYFMDKGLKCDSTELTEIMRQNGESSILTNAMRIRDMLKETRRNKLQFTLKKGEVERLEPEDLVDRYMDCRDEKIVITYANKDADRLNRDIRRRKYGEDVPLQVGDSLIVVRNNYLTGLMNGDLVTVESIGGIESQSAPVYVCKNGGKERKIFKFSFQKVRVKAGDVSKDCLIILNLLENDRADLSIDEEKALFINFCMRYQGPATDRQAFVETLQHDPFFNALQVKYGYAITGHKSQGGEWGTVFVDYVGRDGLDNDSLRWSYTATARARKMLYVINQPDVTPFDKFRVDDIAKVKNIPSEFRVFAAMGNDRFHAADAEDFLKAKCLCIEENLKDTPFKIDSVVSRPYLEIYFIATPEGVERYDLTYKGSHLFAPAREQGGAKNAASVKMLLDDEHHMPLAFNYTPSDDIHQQLYDYISRACRSRLVQITNVVEHNADYYTMYYFRTSATVSYLQVFINDKGFITCARPASLLGKEDGELEELVKLLRI